VRWWVRRRPWLPRPARVGLAIVCGGLALLGWATPSPGQTGGGAASAAPAGPSKYPKAPAPGDPTATFPTSAALAAEGHAIFEKSCASCHGVAAQGMAGTAPALRGVGAGSIDFYVSTGRMPLEYPREEPMRNRPLFERSAINALIAYLGRYGGPPAPTADPAKGDLSLGRHVFTLQCAGCHQMVARGGMTLGAQVPNLAEDTPQQLAEAVRVGPYLMPNFDAKTIDQHELDSIARYVEWTKHPTDAGGWGIYNIGPINEGAVTWWLGIVALVLVIRLIGERAL
jgi:ubiquinol-cytochrome c reductase cytochrome c subunit